MPNIGIETVGATARQCNGNARAYSITMPEDGTLSTITAYLSDSASGDAFGAAIYDSAGNRLQTSNVRTDIQAAGWYTFTGFTQALTNGASYWIMAGSGNSSANANAYFDNGAGSSVTITGSITWPATNDFASAADLRNFSVYATYTAGDPPPTITSVDGDNVLDPDDTSIPIVGTDFDTATVDFEQGAVVVGQTIGSQNATTITLSSVTGFAEGEQLKYGNATVRVTNADLQDDTQLIDIVAEAGTDYVNVATPNPDPELRLEAVPDAEAGDQVQWGNVQGGDETDVVVNNDLTWDCDTAVTAFDARLWDNDDQTWGAWATQTIDDTPSDWTAAGYVRGMAVSAEGVLGTVHLGAAEPVPNTVVFQNGIAFSIIGIMYVCAWPADNIVHYINGWALRPDGAVCVLSGGVASAYLAGVALTSRGEVIVSTSAPDIIVAGLGMTNAGALCVSEAS